MNYYFEIVLLTFLFQLKIYSYFNAFIGSIFVTAKDGNNEARIVINIENSPIDRIELILILLGISSRK